MKRRLLRAGIAAPPLLFLLAFFVYPLATILWESLLSGSTTVGDLWGRSAIRSAAWFTLWQAAVSTVVTLAVGVPLAWATSQHSFRGRRVVRALLAVPFALPTVVVGTAFLAILGPSSPLGLDLSGTAAAVILAHVYFNVAVVVRSVGAMWERLDPRMREAAATLGASRPRIFRRVTLPFLRPALTSSAAIVFLFSMTSFGAVMILGGLELATLEVEIWKQAMLFLDLRAAAILSVIQLMAVIGLLLALGRLERSQPTTSAPTRIRGRRPLLVWALIAPALLFVATPLVSLGWGSIHTTQGASLAAWASLGIAQTSLFVSPLEAVGTSLLFALITATFATLLGGLAAFASTRLRGGRRLDLLLMLPLGTSAVTLGLGFLVALDRPIDLRASPMLIPIAHTVVALPFVVRIASPVLRSIGKRLHEAAAVLGASRLRIVREIDLPLAGRALVAGAGFAAAVSLGEFGATAFVARPGAPTVPVAIFRLLGQPGDLAHAQAMAMSVVLMVMTTVLILGIERFSPAREF